MKKYKIVLNWEQYNTLVNNLANQIVDSQMAFKTILAIGRGGLPLGVMLSNKLKADFAAIMVSRYTTRNNPSRPKLGNIMLHKTSEIDYPLLVVDDLVDEGITLKEVLTKIDANIVLRETNKIKTATLFMKPWSIIRPNYFIKTTSKCVIFPYEEKIIRTRKIVVI